MLKRAPKFLATAIAAGILLLGTASLVPVHATIGLTMHNGLVDPGLTPGTPIPGDGSVNVGLFDVADSQPCGDAWLGPPEFCFLKVWEEGSLNQEHSMTFDHDDVEGWLLSEFVVNDTAVPWTDYHVGIDLGTFDQVLAAIFTVNTLNGVLFLDDMQMLEGDDIVVTDNMAWFFFDEPLLPIAGPNSGRVFAFEALISAPSGISVITQHPSIPEPGTLALFGLGLVGLGIARRKKMAA